MKDTLLIVVCLLMLAVLYATLMMILAAPPPETIPSIPAPCYEPQALQDYKDRYELQKRID